VRVVRRRQAGADVKELPDTRADQEAHRPAKEGPVGPYRLRQLG
jgi:hypothetical protein